MLVGIANILVLNCFGCIGEPNDGVFKLNMGVFGDVILNKEEGKYLNKIKNGNKTKWMS